MMVFKCQSIVNIFNLSGILLLLFLAMVTREAEGRTRKSCGSDLADRIASVCNGEYNELYFTDTVSHSRIRRGIVDDCCKRRCSDTQLRNYYCQTRDPDFATVSDDSSVYVSKEEHPPEENRKSSFETIITHLRYPPTPEIGTVAPEFNLRGVMPPQYRTHDIRFY
ncbi:hypothetical protein DMENIID0001_160110 [Sergentomyia squamirostris]